MRVSAICAALGIWSFALFCVVVLGGCERIDIVTVSSDSVDNSHDQNIARIFYKPAFMERMRRVVGDSIVENGAFDFEMDAVEHEGWDYSLTEKSAKALLKTLQISDVAEHEQAQAHDLIFDVSAQFNPFVVEVERVKSGSSDAAALRCMLKLIPSSLAIVTIALDARQGVLQTRAWQAKLLDSSRAEMELQLQFQEGEDACVELNDDIHLLAKLKQGFKLSFASSTQWLVDNIEREYNTHWPLIPSSVQLRTAEGGFFTPSVVTISMSAARQSQWANKTFIVDKGGADLMLKFGIDTKVANCMVGLEPPGYGPNTLPSTLRPQFLPDSLTPTGLGYDFNVQIAQGSIQNILEHVLAAGFACRSQNIAAISMAEYFDCPLSNDTSQIRTLLTFKKMPQLVFNAARIKLLELGVALRIAANRDGLWQPKGQMLADVNLDFGLTTRINHQKPESPAVNARITEGSQDLCLQYESNDFVRRIMLSMLEQSHLFLGYFLPPNSDLVDASCDGQMCVFYFALSEDG